MLFTTRKQHVVKEFQLENICKILPSCTVWGGKQVLDWKEIKVFYTDRLLNGFNLTHYHRGTTHKIPYQCVEKTPYHEKQIPGKSRFYRK